MADLDEMNAIDDLSAEQKREIGKAYFFNSNGDPAKRSTGIKMIMDAHFGHDPEATYLASRMILDGIIKIQAADQEEYALTQMCISANSGCIQARAFLNAYCEERYQKKVSFEPDNKRNGALVDFEGKPIKINRQGIFTPVDAVLEYKDGVNLLTLSTNPMFLYAENIKDPERFEQAVYRGLLEWQGDYEVFGGQKLSVKIELTSDEKIFDNLFIMPITNELDASIRSVTNVIGTKKKKDMVDELMTSKRSFASHGKKWTVNSRKVICIQSHNGKFDDYEEIKHVAKHEFGHTLGLGDLYASAKDSLEGVEKGSFIELDGYAIQDRFYNLVMCDHHGPISNNDIEMVVLAFSKNKEQLYQPGELKRKISSALGKGN